MTIACVCGLGLSPPATQASGAEESLRFNLPLNDGRLQLRDVLVRICDAFGAESPESLKNIEWSINARSALGRLQLATLERLTDGAIHIHVSGDHVMVTVDRAILQEKAATTGRTMAGWLSDLTGGVREPRQDMIGLTMVTADDSRKPIASVAQLPPRMIVLVHGMDDPGLVWRDLIPQLRKASLPVAEFHYPNDGPISESADHMAAAMSDLRVRGVMHVDIVAHSMGGLVVRDLLTRRTHYHGDGAGADRFPAVDRFIMTGPPNHGAPLAHMRCIGELADHLYRLLNGDVAGLGSADDGHGEAGVDLLPDSDFLRRLNGRALPTHTRITIIAAQWSPVDGQDVREFMEHVRTFAESAEAPQWLRDLASDEHAGPVASLLADGVNGLGDGCVTIDSARLAGVDDFQLVRGNHASMIMNLPPSDAVPPAIPHILDRLGAAGGR